MEITINYLCRGRALYVNRDGGLYVGRKYRIMRSDDGGRNWQLDCYVPSLLPKSLLSQVRLTARLMRHYIAAFEILDDGSRVAIAREGVYRAAAGEVRMTCSFPITRGSRPLNLAVDGPRVLFGEYGELARDREVHIYVSEDRGKTFHVGHSFPAGSIRHIHGIQVDPYRNGYWVFVGDHSVEPGIAFLSKDLRDLNWLQRGHQQCRVVRAIVEPDYLLYGTDSDVERNFIVRVDKDSGKIEPLKEVEGSSLFATSFGPVRVVSTCVERNPACPSRECSLYASLNGCDWQRFGVHYKDWHNLVFFQFGTLVLPYSCTPSARGMFSGQAVHAADDRLSLVEFNDL